MSITCLYLGGSGTISAACVRESVALGNQVTVVNRGQSWRTLPDAVEQLVVDLADSAALRTAVAGRHFDVVCDFLSFDPNRLQRNLDLFGQQTNQYVFISSASVYGKPISLLPITESTPLHNRFWQYSRNKIACEQLLVDLVRTSNFPATIVRPSHTYDCGMLPNQGGWTDITRMRAGKPVVVHGDGTSLWTLTHARDFAYCFARLLGDYRAIGDVFQITGDQVLTWDAIYQELGHAAGVDQVQLVHVASETIAHVLPSHGPGLLGDKAHCAVFDCRKVRSIATGFQQTTPFAVGAREIIAHYDAHPEQQAIDPAIDNAWNQLAGGLPR